MCNSYIKENKNAKNIENKHSYAKALPYKPIVETAMEVKVRMIPYFYAAVDFKRKYMAIVDSGTTGHFLQIHSECVDKRDPK